MIRALIRISPRSSALAALAAASIFLAACQGGGYTRGVFYGYVMGKTEAEIVDKVGQPTSAERTNPDKPVLVYKAKTFDPDNANRTDPETLIYFAKDKSGRLVATDVDYRG